jgi:hypothetical protein
MASGGYRQSGMPPPKMIAEIHFPFFANLSELKQQVKNYETSSGFPASIGM